MKTFGDGLNNDCNHPSWPSLAGTNERDRGISGKSSRLTWGTRPGRARSTWPAFLAVVLALALPGSMAFAARAGFLKRPLTTTALEAITVHAADLDGDGDLDVVSGSRGDSTVAWYENDGRRNPRFPQHAITDAAIAVRSVYAADLDRDEDIDVVWASSSFTDPKVAWLENKGGSPLIFDAHTISTDVRVALSVFAADLDGDGDMDVLSASNADDQIAWYENDGASPPSFLRRVITQDPDGSGPLEGLADGARSLVAADLDGDGDSDIAFAAMFDFGWFENNGASPPNFTPHILGGGALPLFVHAADMDRDGDVDLLTASGHHGRIDWYVNLGGVPPSFVRHSVTIQVSNPPSVFAADVDGDGDMDVLSASAGNDTIAWYESDGASLPSFTTHVIDTRAMTAAAVFAADLDGDGDVDPLAALVDDNTVAWYRNSVVPGGQ